MPKFTIHKYTLAPAKEQTVAIPRSARVVDVQMQPQPDETVALCVWALVLVGDQPQPRRVVFVDTGEALDGDFVEKFEHVKTLQVMHPRMGAAGEPELKSIVHHIYLERPAVN